MQSENSLIYLVSCAVNQKIPEKSIIDGIDIAQVFSIASSHMLKAAVSMALESAGYKNEYSSKAIAFSFRNLTIFEKDKNAILENFEKSGIWYMMLKGSILKDYYPKFGMREMSDYDILFDSSRAEDVKNIMENLGFSTVSFGIDNEDVYYKSPVSCFEMHRKLFSVKQEKNIYDYFINIKSRLIKDDNKNYSFHFSPEDFYVYLVTHEYIHYSKAGTGLRSLLDTYVFLKKFNLNWDYVETEIKKLGISDFEKINRRLALNIFSGNLLKDEEKKMLNYILSSGTYGNLKNESDNEISKYGRFKYFLRRLTLPYPYMLEQFPILNKMPFLYPVFWIGRLFRGILFRRKVFIHQLRAVLGLKNY